MKKCNQCGFEQDDGKFCGKCGNPLVDAVDSEVSEDETVEAEKQPEVKPTSQSIDQQSNEGGSQQPEDKSPEPEQSEVAATMAQGEETGAGHSQGGGATQGVETVAAQTKGAQTENQTVERMKETSKEFWSYFTYYLKQPSHIFAKRSTEVNNGIINIVVMLILLSLSTYFLIRNFTIVAGFGYVQSVPFFPIFGNTIFFTALFIILVVAILFGVNKLFGTGYSFKEVLSLYGGHLSLATILAAAAFILLLVKANLIGMILITIVFGLAITSAPIYLISSLLTQKSKSLDPYYGYLIYTVAVGIGFFILFTILADSTIGGFFDELSYYL